MPEDIARITGLLNKLLNQEIEPGEMEELERWKNMSSENQALYDEFVDKYALRDEIRKYYQFAEATESTLQGILARPRNSAGILQMRKWKIFMAAAAIITILVLAGMLLYPILKSKNDYITRATDSISKPKTPSDIPPGGNHAILKLTDASTIIIDSMGIGETIQQGGMVVTKEEDGKVVITGSSTGSIDLSGGKKPKLNTLETPAGGQYKVELPDHSMVTMNSKSVLAFPSVFGNVRDVTLTGEAFFEVTKDSLRPFNVIVSGVNIRVTGTKFNVKAYPDETIIHSTLLEGGIRVTNTPKGSLAYPKTTSVTIQVEPGQEVQVDQKTKSIKLVKDVDVDAAIAWKNGKFAMTGYDIPTILRQISRWYDVEILYLNGIPTGTISGEISKSLNLSQVIQVLKESGVKLRLEGKRLIVAP